MNNDDKPSLEWVGAEKLSYQRGFKDGILSVEDKWQPIETAPKSEIPESIYYETKKHRILVLDRGLSDLICIGHWCPHMLCWYDDADWDLSPTHWMPLPNPPEASNEN